jgi:SAM-dependent methyltransferase
LSFVEASTYDALSVLEPGFFDLVFTGIGALCWLPDIRRWASVVSNLLKPGGRFFIREGHPVLWSIDEKITSHLQIQYPYFETLEPMVIDDDSTYMPLADKSKKFESTKTMEWNHGLGEIVQALLDEGLEITGLTEHRSVPWEALPGQMVDVGNGKLESLSSYFGGVEGN